MDLLRVYYECLNKTYKDDSLEPLLTSLYKIINYYDGDLTRIVGISDNSAVFQKRKNMIIFINGLLLLLKNLIQNNNYQNFDDTVEFLYESRVPWYCLIDALKSLYCQDSLNRDDYFNNFEGFCNYAYYTDPNKFDFSLKIIDYLKIYTEYYKSLTGSRDYAYRLGFFARYAPKIMAILYKNKTDSKNLYKAFDYLLDNDRALLGFVHNNFDGIHQNELAYYLVDIVINNYLNNNCQVVKD